MSERTLKVGDIVSYEPTRDCINAQCMWGCVGVVRELGEDHEGTPTLFLRWIHHLPKGVDDQWLNMRVTEGNCRKLGEVPPGEDGAV